MDTTIELLAGEQQRREHNKAILACNDYLRLGPGRSLSNLLAFYANTDQIRPTTWSKSTLKEWSQRFCWQERAATYDAKMERRRKEQEAEASRQYDERRRQIMETGLALMHERVYKLDQMAEFLLKELYDTNDDGRVIGFQRDKIWLPDVKQIGSGESAERVNIVRFNAPLFETIRGLLDDLAKETGGRRQKIEHTGQNGMPITVATSELEHDELIILLNNLILAEAVGSGGGSTIVEPPPSGPDREISGPANLDN
jgi:hypothetical protein